MTRGGAILSILLGLAAAVTELQPVPVIAQDSEIVVAQNDRPGFFRRLFGGGRRSDSPPIFAPDQLFPGLEAPPPRRERRERRARPAEPTAREIAAVEKAENAKRALVVGDFFATALAKGLADAYGENPNVVVIDATNGSSGLVRNDFYDWPAKISGIIAEQKPDAILVIIGGNDRQGIQTDAGARQLGTDEWRAAYAARVAAFADAMKATGKPILWGGLVPVSGPNMARDYSAFNGIVREQLEAKGLPFVDMWNGFADDEGKYVDIGPDVRGQSVQLRSSDGLNFTRAGQRKLAFFVEQELNAIFGGTSQQLLSAAAAEPGDPNAPQIGPMVPIEALSLIGADALSSRHKDAELGEAASTISARLADTEAEPPPEARVDSYIWPPRPAAVTPPAESAGSETPAGAASGTNAATTAATPQPTPAP
jgi:hypothetical protein